MRVRQLLSTLASMGAILDDAERREQPPFVAAEFERLRLQATALHASLYPGPPDGGEIGDLSARAAGLLLSRRRVEGA